VISSCTSVAMHSAFRRIDPAAVLRASLSRTRRSAHSARSTVCTAYQTDGDSPAPRRRACAYRVHRSHARSVPPQIGMWQMEGLAPFACWSDARAPQLRSAFTTHAHARALPSVSTWHMLHSAPPALTRDAAQLEPGEREAGRAWTHSVQPPSLRCAREPAVVR